MGKKTDRNENIADQWGNVVDNISMSTSDWAANRQQKKMNNAVIDTINSFKKEEQESNKKLIDIINAMNENVTTLINISKKQNLNLLKQNQLIMKCLNNVYINNEENNTLIELLQDTIPQNIHCSNCNNEFYSTNKSFHEDKKCPYCNHSLENIEPLKIKKTIKIEEGICPYCESKVHTNDLICPHCYEKLTPIYDELIEEKLKKEKEKQEQEESFLFDNEEEIYEFYSNLLVNQNYSEEYAMSQIISKYGITNVDILKEVSESKKWDERLKIEISLKEQADIFLKEKEDELFDSYHDLILNEKYSETDAKKEILKKFDITNPYIIKKLNDIKWDKWIKKIDRQRLLREKEIFKTYCKIILDEKQPTDIAKKRIIEEYNLTEDDFLKMKKSNDWDKKLIDEEEKREEQEKIRYLKAKADYKKNNTKPCPICGETNDADSKFCMNCQHNFTKERRLTRFTKAHEKKACPMCKSYNEVNFNYCKYCGYKFPTENKKEHLSKNEEPEKSTICPKCGVKNEIGSNFCQGCGNKL